MAGLPSSLASQTAEDAFTWSPDFFPILPWDPQHGWKTPYFDREQGLETIAECGFTMAGFVRAQDLPACERLGLRAIMFPDVESVPVWSREWHQLSDEEIESRVKTFIEQSGQSDAILGYYIIDEPNASHFPALGKAVAAVRKHAPGKLAYINLYPNYATVGAPDTSQLGTATYAEYLERFVGEVKPQLVSYDNYLTQVSMDMTDPARTAAYFTNLLDIRRVALDNGLPFWNIVSSNQIRPHTTVPSPANLLLQAYTTLAAGGTGVSWYKYYGDGYAYSPIDGAGTRTATWDYLQMVNRQLKVIGPIINGLTSTGVYFTADEPPGELPRLPGKVVKEVGVGTPVMVGEFHSEDGADYAMVVNLSLRESVRLFVETEKGYSTRQAFSPASGESIALDADNSLQLNQGSKRRMAPGGEDYRNGLWLAAGQGVLLKLEE
jgi:hypothetical protein